MSPLPVPTARGTATSHPITIPPMLKRLAGPVAVAALALAAPVTTAEAQVALGYTDVGGVIGLGGIGGANFSIGGRFEKVFKKLPDLGDGLLGIGVSADVYSYDFGPGSLRYIPIGATANYHFKLDPKKKLDVFLGAGLGYSLLSCSGLAAIGAADFEERVVSQVPTVSASVASAAAGSCGTFGSNLYFIGRAGGRYFLKPNLAVYGDLGAGAAHAQRRPSRSS